MVGNRVGAELRLTALALGEDDEPLGHGERHVRAVMLADEGQSQVDARRHAGRGDEPAVPAEDAIRLDDGQVEAPGQLPRMLPVRGDLALVEEPGGAERERAGADGAVAGLLRGDVAKPVDQLAVDSPAGKVAAARHQRDVPRAASLLEGEVGDEQRSIGGSNRRSDRRRHGEGVAPVFRKKLIRLGEDVQRAGDIERLDAREDGNDDSSQGASFEKGRGWQFRTCRWQASTHRGRAGPSARVHSGATHSSGGPSANSHLESAP